MVIKYAFVLCLFLNSLPLLEAQVKNNVFDLNGVLFTHNTWHSFKRLGLSRIIRYAIEMKSSPIMAIKSRFFEVLEAIFPRPEGLSTEWQAQDSSGNNLPYIMQEWIKGTKNGPEIIDQIKTRLAAKPALCKSNLEKELILQIVADTFDPKEFVETQTLHPQAIELILMLKNQGHKLFVLSNWNPESFNYLQEKYPHLFDLFDGIMISDGLAKPDPAIYQNLLATFQLDPKETLFIDDQLVNVKSARSVGMHAVVCPIKKNYFKSSPNLLKIPKIIAQINKKETEKVSA